MSLPFIRHPYLLVPGRPLAVLLGLVYSAVAPAADRRFYRLNAPQGTEIQFLSLDGFLSWTTPVAAGTYLVEASDDLTAWQPWARGSLLSVSTTLRVHDPRTPSGMSFIPGGRFTMGDDVAVTNGNIKHSVTVSPFYISSTETTAEQGREVYQWALDHGKIQVSGTTIMNTEGDPRVLAQLTATKSLVLFNGAAFYIQTRLAAQPPASGWSGRHPLTGLTWYGAVAFCNYLSEKQGKERCYNLTTWSCDFSKQGYRLPTESEWEKAARGGYEGRRFAWGDTITHSQANYTSSTANAYDISPTSGKHPVYNLNRPLYTSPWGAFPPNGYGLYDVAGNAFEWVWDVSGRYTGLPLTDPTGPDIPNASGNPMFKGGSFLTTAERVLLPFRYTGYARDFTHEDIGFRMALNLPP